MKVHTVATLDFGVKSLWSYVKCKYIIMTFFFQIHVAVLAKYSGLDTLSSQVEKGL